MQGKGASRGLAEEAQKRLMILLKGVEHAAGTWSTAPRTRSEVDAPQEAYDKTKVACVLT